MSPIRSELLERTQVQQTPGRSHVSGIEFGKSRFPRVCIDQEARTRRLAVEHFKSRSHEGISPMSDRATSTTSSNTNAPSSVPFPSSGMTCHVYPNKKTTAGDDVLLASIATKTDHLAEKSPQTNRHLHLGRSKWGETSSWLAAKPDYKCLTT